MEVRIVPTTAGAPAGKLAEAELCFDQGPLSGLKLVGFTVWAGRGDRGHYVTFPARQYSVNGERRHYLLLRTTDTTASTDPLRTRILQAYASYEERRGSAGAEPIHESIS